MHDVLSICQFQIMFIFVCLLLNTSPLHTWRASSVSMCRGSRDTDVNWIRHDACWVSVWLIRSGVLTIYLKDRKFLIENQMVCAIIFGKLQNVEAFLGNAIFPLRFSLFSLCGYTLPADCSPTTSNFIVLPIYAQDVHPGGLSKW